MNGAPSLAAQKSANPSHRAGTGGQSLTAENSQPFEQGVNVTGDGIADSLSEWALQEFLDPGPARLEMATTSPGVC